MSKLDEIGIIGDDGGSYWGSKRKYPTKEAFLDAVRRIEGEIEERNVTETYMRRGRSPDGESDMWWRICKGPARGATAVWECC